MRRADRLFQIVQYLRGGRLLTAQALADRLEVTKRTIYRDVADLIGSGVPIEGEAGVGYIMRDGYEVPPLMFTSDEIVALVAGARLIRAYGGSGMALAAEEALVKIEAVVPTEARARAAKVGVNAIAGEAMTDEVRSALDTLEQASNDRSRIEIAYTDEEGAETTRVLRPLGLWFWGKVWTLVAWCEMRQDFRMFRVDRMVGITLLDRFREERGQSLRDFFARDDRRKR